MVVRAEYETISGEAGRSPRVFLVIARSALYLRDVYGRTTEICPFRDDVTEIITFCRAANEVVHSALVKYVIFEKFRSDPEKDRC